MKEVLLIVFAKLLLVVCEKTGNGKHLHGQQPSQIQISNEKDNYYGIFMHEHFYIMFMRIYKVGHI